MLQVNFIRENRERVLKGLKVRSIPDSEWRIVDRIIELDDLRKATQTERDNALAQRNRLSREIGDLFKSGQREAAEERKTAVSDLKEKIAQLEEKLNQAKAQLEDLLLQLPNVPHDSVPPGSSEEDNEVYRAWEKPLPDLGPEARPHWELAEQYGIIDLELGVKLTGAGFPVYRGKGARLERALIAFFLDEAAQAGYEEVIPPLLVNTDTARGTGQLPDKEGQMYHVQKDELYLIPTAEVPLTNIYREEILKEDDLPIRIAGYTPCFRREAGSHGSEVRGLNRVHQFDKVEIVHIEHPGRSYDTLMKMLDHVSGLLDKLELPYRILRLCGGDLGFTSALTFDFEVYSAGQDRWLEVSSVSNFETFQSNRMMMRYRDADNRIHLVHTLNGSALALARVVAALLENNQTERGIVIPEVLRPYTRFDVID